MVVLFPVEVLLLYARTDAWIVAKFSLLPTSTPGHPRASSSDISPAHGLILGVAPRLNLLEILLATALAQSTPCTQPARRSLGGLILLFVAVEAHGRVAGVVDVGGSLRGFCALQILCFFVEGRKHDIKTFALGGDEVHFFARRLKIGGNKAISLRGANAAAEGSGSACGGRNSGGEQVVEVGAGISGPGPCRCWDTKAGKQGLGVAGWTNWHSALGCGLGWGETQDFGLEELDGVTEIGDTSSLEAVVCAGDELVDLSLVFFKEGVDFLFIDEAGALGLGEDQVEEEQQADIAVEGDPTIVNRDVETESGPA